MVETESNIRKCILRPPFPPFTYLLLMIKLKDCYSFATMVRTGKNAPVLRAVKTDLLSTLVTSEGSLVLPQDGNQESRQHRFFLKEVY